MLAYEYPLLGIFWTTIMVFLWVAWLLLLFRIFGDIFRSKDMGGGAKALWSLFVILLPLLGTLVYLIVRGAGMTQRDVHEAESARQAFDDYVRETAGTASPADEVAKLKDLEERGAITAAEFEAQKARILG